MTLITEIQQNIELSLGRTEKILWKEARQAVEKRFPSLGWHDVCHSLLQTYDNKAHSPTPFDFIKAAQAMTERLAFHKRTDAERAENWDCFQCWGNDFEPLIVRRIDEKNGQEVITWNAAVGACSKCNTKKHRSRVEYRNEYKVQVEIYSFNESEMKLFKVGQPVYFQGVSGYNHNEIAKHLMWKEKGLDCENIQTVPSRETDSDTKPVDGVSLGEKGEDEDGFRNTLTRVMSRTASNPTGQSGEGGAEEGDDYPKEYYDG